MKRVFIGLPYIFFTVILIIGSCGSFHKHRNIMQVIQAEQAPHIPIIPAQPVKHDTLVKVIHSIQEIKEISKVNDLAKFSPVADTLFKRNLDLQFHYMRAIDRARDIRLKMDTLGGKISDLISSQRDANKRADEFYLAAKQSNYYKAQNQTYEKGTNIFFYIGFIAVVLILSGQSLVLYRIRKAQKLLYQT